MSLTAASTDTLCQIVLAVQDSRLAFTACSCAPESEGPPQSTLRFEGTTAGIQAQVNQLLQLAKYATQVDIPPNAPDIWKAREALWTGTEPALIGKFSVLPRN